MEENTNSNDKLQQEQQKSKARINRGFWELTYGLGEFLKHIFSIPDEELDREGTIENIRNNKKMEGANVWLLVCSIMVASLGLDLNSPAVIIGAMLISPLMSPILGVGLAVGINDRETLSISLRHFGIAIVIALITSIIYFSFTPLGEMTNEIEARTRPTLLDVFVAIFGGLAGIISSSRKDKSNAIPGVAIATALMPPLCVAGFGIAKGEFVTFINSFYLFFLNSVFIALTTFLIVRYLDFPYTSFINKREKARTSMMVLIFSVIIILPSAWILWGVVSEERQRQAVRVFMEQDFSKDGRQYLGHEIMQMDSANYVFIDYYSKEEGSIPEALLEDYKKKLTKAGIEKPLIVPRSTQNVNALVNREVGENRKEYNEKIKEYADQMQEKDRIIAKQKVQMDSVSLARDVSTIVEEAKVFLPDLVDVDLVESKFDEVPILLIRWNDDIYSSANNKKLVHDFVKIKTGLDTLVVY